MCVRTLCCDSGFIIFGMPLFHVRDKTKLKTNSHFCCGVLESGKKSFFFFLTGIAIFFFFRYYFFSVSLEMLSIDIEYWCACLSLFFILTHFSLSSSSLQL